MSGRVRDSETGYDRRFRDSPTELKLPQTHAAEKNSGTSAGALHDAGMMKLSALLLVLMFAMVARAAPPAGFCQQLTPEERRAAGVDQLSPAQQAALDQLADRFARQVREQAKQEVREEAKAEVREQVKREAREQAKTEVRAEVKQEVREEVKRELTAERKVQAEARAGLPSADNEAVIRTRIVGKFNGWSGDTVFQLANGQTWVQANSSDSLWLPAMENPEVELRTSKIGGWKLFLVDQGFWLRVRRVK